LAVGVVTTARRVGRVSVLREHLVGLGIGHPGLPATPTDMLFLRRRRLIMFAGLLAIGPTVVAVP